MSPTTRDRGANMPPIVTKVVSILGMNSRAVISSTSLRRIGIARGWLENRTAAEEVLIVGATPDAANELARKVAKEKGAAFGWHRLTLPQLALLWQIYSSDLRRVRLQCGHR